MKLKVLDHNFQVDEIESSEVMSLDISEETGVPYLVFKDKVRDEIGQVKIRIPDYSDLPAWEHEHTDRKEWLEEAIPQHLLFKILARSAGITEIQTVIRPSRDLHESYDLPSIEEVRAIAGLRMITSVTGGVKPWITNRMRIENLATGETDIVIEPMAMIIGIDDKDISFEQPLQADYLGQDSYSGQLSQVPFVWWLRVLEMSGIK